MNGSNSDPVIQNPGTFYLIDGEVRTDLPNLVTDC